MQFIQVTRKQKKQKVIIDSAVYGTNMLVMFEYGSNSMPSKVKIDLRSADSDNYELKLNLNEVDRLLELLQKHRDILAN